MCTFSPSIRSTKTVPGINQNQSSKPNPYLVISIKHVPKKILSKYASLINTVRRGPVHPYPWQMTMTILLVVVVVASKPVLKWRVPNQLSVFQWHISPPPPPCRASPTPHHIPTYRRRRSSPSGHNQFRPKAWGQVASATTPTGLDTTRTRTRGRRQPSGSAQLNRTGINTTGGGIA